MQIAQAQLVATPTPTSVIVTPAVSSGSSEKNTDHLIAIKSPIVGTFYRSSSPDKPAFVKVGDTISAGDVVCVVEAMKLFNEIESEISGTIEKILVEDAQPVEYDQVLFLLNPKG
jgi:acetyl-CoA carboxylase biotin carboxyl carrier protein